MSLNTNTNDLDNCRNDLDNVQTRIEKVIRQTKEKKVEEKLYSALENVNSGKQYINMAAELEKNIEGYSIEYQDEELVMPLDSFKGG